jgi:hypothetical protein
MFWLQKKRKHCSSSPPANSRQNQHCSLFIINDSNQQRHLNPSQPAPTGDSPQQRQRNRSSPATIYRAILFSSDNGSTHQPVSSSPESSLGIPNSHQNPRQLSTTSTATNRIFSYSRPLSTPSTDRPSSHHFAPPVNPHSASTADPLVTTATTNRRPHPSSPEVELHRRRQQKIFISSNRQNNNTE